MGERRRVGGGGNEGVVQELKFRGALTAEADRGDDYGERNGRIVQRRDDAKHGRRNWLMCVNNPLCSHRNRPSVS